MLRPGPADGGGAWLCTWVLLMLLGSCSPIRVGEPYRCARDPVARRGGASSLGNAGRQSPGDVCPAATTPTGTAWAAFSTGAAQADSAATRTRGALVSARDVGRLSLVGSVARIAIFQGAGEGAWSRRRSDRARGRGCPAQSLRVRAQAHSREQPQPRRF